MFRPFFEDVQLEANARFAQTLGEHQGVFHRNGAVIFRVHQKSWGGCPWSLAFRWT